jgi:hypothetical protein
MDAFEYNGIWWLPGEPENQISGVLRFDPLKSINLQLIGIFNEKFSSSAEFVQFIHGLTVDAKVVTLWDCYESRQHTWKSGYATDRSSYDVGVILFGHHFAKSEDILFESLSINYSALAEWIGAKVFDINEDKFSQQYTVNYRRPPEIKAALNNATVILRQSFGYSSNINEVKLAQTALVTVRPKQPTHIDALLKNYFYHIRNFLSLGIGQPIYPQIVAGSVPEVREEISIYYPIKDASKFSTISHPRNMLFSFTDISENFEEYLRAWFAKSELLDPVYELYFSILYSSDLYLNIQFLLLAQALEVYHRRRYKGTYLDSQEYKTVRKILIDAIPNFLSKDHKQSLQSRISFGNEYTLLTRLKLILNEVLDPYSAQVSALVEDREKFARKIKATRNYLTHFTVETDTIFDTKERYIYVQKMKLLLQMCFLIELEIPPEQASQLIDQNRYYAHQITQSKGF